MSMANPSYAQAIRLLILEIHSDTSTHFDSFDNEKIPIN